MNQSTLAAQRIEPLAVIGGTVASGLIDLTSDLSALDSSGWWAVVIPFDGEPVCARFERRRPTAALPRSTTEWAGPSPQAWTSSLSQSEYADRIAQIRNAIAAGDVYQVNLTRRMSAPLPHDASMLALGHRLAAGNPAPFAAVIELPEANIRVASASPELFLSRDGHRVRSAPIKGTTSTGGNFSEKDCAENVMIVDLVRNDLGRVCQTGTVLVPNLLERQHHPGLDHLVSTVEGELRENANWPELLAATFAPGSVTGAPKIAAVEQIRSLEPVERGIYCGAIGWVDADRNIGELNVAIRTFWVEEDTLCFGTGGAVTWDSTADDEWAETELKANRLIALASDRSS
ncbi:MAG: anthranilate synthase component I family protein [Acidimicrobiales bacterium]